MEKNGLNVGPKLREFASIYIQAKGGRYTFFDTVGKVGLCDGMLPRELTVLAEGFLTESCFVPREFVLGGWVDRAGLLETE